MRTGHRIGGVALFTVVKASQCMKPKNVRRRVKKCPNILPTVVVYSPYKVAKG